MKKYSYRMIAKKMSARGGFASGGKTKFFKIFFLLAMFLIVTRISLADDPLIYANNFHYLGSFRVPNTDPMAGGGNIITYNPINNSLFITGHGEDNKVAEITIPTLHSVTGSDYSNLSTASFFARARSDGYY